MSNDSNNIYNILGKLEALKPTAQEKHDATVKAIYESVEAQGSIISGVDAVQAKLARQFAESKTDEGIIGNIKNTVRAANYDRLANRSANAGGWDSMYSRSEWDRDQAKSAQRAQKAQDIRKAVDHQKAIDSTTSTMGPQGLDYDNIKANYKEDTCNECGLTMEGCGCDHTNEGIVDSIKLAFGKTMAWVVDTAAKFANNPELKDKMAQARVDLANKAEQQMLGLIAGHPREEQLKQQVNYIVTQLKQQQTMRDLITVAQKLGAEFKAERSKFSENGDGVNDVDMPTASPADEPAGSPDDAPQGTVTVEPVDSTDGKIYPGEYIEEEDLEEAEITRKAGVTTHRKTDFPGYPADDINDPDAEPADRKRGRPRKHAAKAPTGLGRGRPVKAAAPSYSKQADPFGRVSGTVPKGTKGTVHSMSEAMNTLGNKLARITEGVNFQKMAEETHQTIDELMNELQNDIKEYKTTGHCSDKLKDFMQVHAHSKKQVADEAAALVAPKPMAPAGGIHGSYMDPMSAKDQQAKINPQRTYEEEVDPMEEELRKLAELAGLGEVSRGEYIKQQDTKAERSGKHEFNAFGQLFNTNDVDEELEQEGTLFTKGLEDDNVKIGDKIPGTDAIKTKDIDTVDEADVTVDKPNDDELANEPNPKYGTIKNITTQGDDINREKRQFADKPKLGDNPMATLEAKLAKEYESIKKKVTDPHKEVNKEVSFDEEDNTLNKAKAK